MGYDELLQKPASKKHTLLEVDSPLTVIWTNISPGRYSAYLTPGKQTDQDDHGNLAYFDGQNEEYYNMGSLSVMGELYTKAASFAAWEAAAPKTWFYDTDTTLIYLTIDGYDPPRSVQVIKPGAIIGFSNSIDVSKNNIYGGIYYNAILNSMSTLSKQKDPLFFGIIQFQGGSATLDSTGGLVDNLSERGLYGQPLRVRNTFEGLPYAESRVIYTARVGKFVHTWNTLNISIIDLRNFLKRKLPVNVFTKTDSGSDFYFPAIEDRLDGIPVPISFGPAIKAPAYKTDTGEWKFADTTYNAVDFGITVYNTDGTIFIHGGIETDGTFTGTDTDDDLTVSFTQSTVENGLDVISFSLEKYENIPFDSLRYDLAEWNSEKTKVRDTGIWLGQGQILSTIDIITKICEENQGIFEVLADGRYTFRKLDPDAVPVAEIELDEVLDVPKRIDDPTEVLAIVRVEYSENIESGLFEIYNNTEFRDSVFAKYENYPEKIYRTGLTSEADAAALSDDIMELAKDIFPSISFNTKTQYIEARIQDIILYTYKRINGKILIPRSRYQILSIGLDLMAYEITFGIKQIAEDPDTQI